MSALAKPPTPDVAEQEILTLAGAAAFPRAPEQAVLDLASTGAVPGQRVGGEWRFLKRAVVEWLRRGPPPRGSSRAVLRHFGAFRDPDEPLAAACAKNRAVY